MINKSDRLNQINYVVKNSEYVKINLSNLENYVRSLKIVDNVYWLKKLNLNLTEKELILLVFIIESMNFCFWKKPYIEKKFNGEYHKRSTAMFYSIVDAVINNQSFLDINNLINMSKNDLVQILGGNSDLPLIDERYDNLIETVRIIYGKEDSFYNELFEIKSDEELLNYIVSNFPSFKDEGIYKGNLVCFYKRATLLVRDLYEVSNVIRNNIKNIDNMLACADYVLPKVFRYYEILEYSKDLQQIIDGEMLIEHNSNYEVEIRANMLYVVELIRQELIKRNICISSVLLDNSIWNTGRNIEEKHHLTETIYY